MNPLYNIDEEDEKYWTPDKLAVFMARKLAIDGESPLCGHIKVAPKRDEIIEEVLSDSDWGVSTAVVVEGISRLFSSNLNRDANLMNEEKKLDRHILDQQTNDRTPLREIFIEGNDALIYKLVLNYLGACEDVFWSKVRAKSDSVILKTIGVQALFDILKKLAEEAVGEKDIRKEYFIAKLQAAGEIDFSEDKYRNLSGSGRVRIRRELEQAIGIKG